MRIRNVLVTGTAGYIGAVLTEQLLERGYKVWGIDSLMFGEEPLGGFRRNPNYKFVKGDIRESKVYKAILGEVEAVIHLASIVGVPACSRDPEVARETNWIATKDLFDIAGEKACIKRFVFASTTSVYGRVKGNGFVNEKSELNPLSLYAELKARCEEYVLKGKSRGDFLPTALRFPTAYGVSPRMRFDLTVNEFTRECALGKELEIFGAQFSRPYCHVADLARACIRVLEVDGRLVDHEVYCVGSSEENYTKRMIYEILVELIPDGRVSFVEKMEDPRDYRVDFSKIEELDFKPRRTVKDGVREIYELLRKGVISNPYDPMYANV
jgi:nucleoside-diphosphate-sugar epimerase